MTARLIVLLCSSTLVTLSGCNNGADVTAPVSGTIHVTAATTGTQLDDNGYLISLDGGTAQALSPNASLDLTSVAAGAHDVQLTDIAVTCGTIAANPQQVLVPSGGTAQAHFAVVCGPPGSVTVTTHTQFVPGPLTVTHGLSIDGVDRGKIGPNTSVVFGDLGIGVHSVQVTAGNGCTFGFLVNPHHVETKSVTVQPAQNVTVEFSVLCLG